jgi:hypothetical protein
MCGKRLAWKDRLWLDGVCGSSKTLDKKFINTFDFQRYGRKDKRDKLPRWIQENIKEASVNITVEEATVIARQWLRTMSQPFTMEHQRGVSLLTEEMLAQDGENIMEKFSYVMREIL